MNKASIKLASFVRPRGSISPYTNLGGYVHGSRQLSSGAAVNADTGRGVGIVSVIGGSQTAIDSSFLALTEDLKLDVAWEPRQQHLELSTGWSPIPFNKEIYSCGVMVGNCVIELVEIRALSQLQKIIGKKKHEGSGTIISVGMKSEAGSPSACDVLSSMELDDAMSLVSRLSRHGGGDIKPIITDKFIGKNEFGTSLANLKLTGDEIRIRGIKEVVVGHPSVQDITASITTLKGIDSQVQMGKLNVWHFGTMCSPAIRLIPDSFSSIILQVDDLDTSVKYLSDASRTSHSFVGKTGGHPGQVRLHVAGMEKLDVRLCADSSFFDYFNKCSDTMMEEADYVEELQPHSRKAGSGSGVGDCWMEFRAMMKSPAGFFKK